MRAEAQLQFVKSSIELGQLSTVLDIGCSEGCLLLEFQQVGCKVLGYEPDSRMAHFANQRLAQGEETVVKNELFSASNLAVESVDLVCSSHVLEHVSNPFSYLQEIQNVLSSSGFLFLEIPNQYDLSVEKCINPEVFPSAPTQGHLYFYSPKSIKSLLESNGFEVLKIATCGRSVEGFFEQFKEPKLSRLRVFSRKIYSKLRKRIVFLNRLHSRYFNCKDEKYDVKEIMNNYWQEDGRGQWIRLLARVAK